MLIPILHFLGFQACWFISVLSAADGNPWRGPICIAVFATLHVFFLARRKLEVLRLFVAASFGLVADKILMILGVLDFGPHQTALPPVWMIALWALFMTTLPVTMPWLRGRYLLGAAVGAIAGPVCYLAGGKLDALAIGPNQVFSISMISLEWIIATPLLIYLTKATGSWIDDNQQTQELPHRPGAAQ